MILSALFLCAVLQTPARPGTLPPSAELADKTSIIGVDDSLIFAPALGGLLMPGFDGDISQSKLSDSGFIVNLRTDELSYVGTPDIFDRQINCPSAVFARCYRSELAKTAKHSPGLPDGWVHNYDVIIKLPTGTQKWEPVTLTYPNKAQETIEPVLDDQGKPNGKGHSVSNATYDVDMEPGDAINSYKSITIKWPNSSIDWAFETHTSGVMVLRNIKQYGPIGNLRLSYYPDRTLASVSYQEQDLKLLTFTYSGGMLATATSRPGYTAGYSYSQVSGSYVLWKVSQPFKSDETPKDGFVFSYANDLPYPALAQISVPNNGGWSKSIVEYRDGKISAVQGASGTRQEVGSPGGNRK